jgi:hypothetical protein
MSFHIEKLPNENILVHTLNADFNPIEELDASNHAILSALRNQEKPVFVVVDMTATRLTLEGVIVSANKARTENIMANPHIREILIVTRDELLIFASKGLNSQAFGFLKVKIFPSVEKALAYARAQRED